jgi:DNA-binding transcriptional LysR family regulator
VTLTAAARAALRRFRIALSEIDASHSEALLAERQARSRIRVGALTVAMLDLIPQSLGQYIGPSGEIQVEIIEGTVDGLSGKLLRGELDLVVGQIGLTWARSPEAAQLDQIKLFDEPRCIVCRTAHPLASAHSPSLARLAREQWVLQPLPSSSRQAFEEMFVLRGLTAPVPIVESASAHSCLDIVARTDLLAVSPLALAHRQIELGRVHRVNCPIEPGEMAICAIWRRTSESDPIVSSFRDALVDFARRPRRSLHASRPPQAARGPRALPTEGNAL